MFSFNFQFAVKSLLQNKMFWWILHETYGSCHLGRDQFKRNEIDRIYNWNVSNFPKLKNKFWNIFLNFQNVPKYFWNILNCENVYKNCEIRKSFVKCSKFYKIAEFSEILDFFDNFLLSVYLFKTPW